MHVIICDDDEVTLREYRAHIEEIAQKHDFSVFVDCYANGENLLFELSDAPNEADLIYLDINFEEKMDGIRTAARLRDLGYGNDVVFFDRGSEPGFRLLRCAAVSLYH